MKSKPLVSIIIPVYNAEEYVPETLDSILSQTHKELEILLINDGSTDNSLEVLKNYAQEDERIKIFTIENSGPATSRNYGLDRFTGDFVMFVDSDDIITSDLIETLLMNVENTDEISMCKFSKEFSKIGTGTKDTKKTTVFVESVKQMYSPGFASSGPVTKLYGREIFKTLRIPEFQMYEDAAMSLQPLSLAKKISFVDYYGYYYRFNPNSLTNKQVSKRNYTIFDKTTLMLNFARIHHPEALDIVKRICLNDNDYVMLECTRSKTELSKKLFDQLFDQNRKLSKNVGLRGVVYSSRSLLWLGLKMMNKLYYNDFIRNVFKKVLGV
jgi:glycosyltransferase involved in cell wall biosynthesis